jgi:hypothetical protein
MAVWTNNCVTGFSKIFAKKSFLYKNMVRTDACPLQVISITGFARPNHGAGVSGRLNFNTQFPYLIRVCPDHERDTSRRLKSNRQLPYTMHQCPDNSCQMSGRFILNCDSCPYGDMRPDGIPHRPDS